MTVVRGNNPGINSIKITPPPSPTVALMAEVKKARSERRAMFRVIGSMKPYSKMRSGGAESTGNESKR
jgi:hypothetical protein